MGYPTQVRYFWDYRASVNIIFKKRLLKAIQDDKESLRKAEELQQGAFVSKIKIELAELVV